MFRVFITRQIPEAGIQLLKDKGYEVDINPDDRVLSKDEIISSLKSKAYDAVLCLLTDKIDRDIFEAAGQQCKIFANYAVGYDNLDLTAAKELNIILTNTPGVLTETVAEHTFALMLAIAHRIPESDKFTRAGLYKGWGPMLLLGTDVSAKTLGIIGLGRIGIRVAQHAVKGFDMKAVYYDVNRNEEFEKDYGAQFVSLEDLLKNADFVSIHVPLLPSTTHLLGEAQFRLMKRSAYLINTSRGPVIDEAALVEALREKVIKGAALDVYEFEPKLTAGLEQLDNVVLTPHTASATEETRSKMAVIAAQNVIAALEGQVPPNLINNK